MGWRPIASVILGLALWWFLFFAIGIGFGAVWPEYRGDQLPPWYNLIVPLIVSGSILLGSRLVSRSKPRIEVEK